MLDRTIPFFNAILRCDEYEFQPVLLPNGYQIVSYQSGFEKDWARLEYEIGDFDSEEEAKAYFNEQYLHHGRNDDILFLRDKSGMIIGSCIAWTDKRQGLPVHSLHWLIVSETNQRKGLGRALCTAVMNRFIRKGGGPIYIHTQPWSWKAILLYLSLGFRMQKTDSFNSYVNQYEDVMITLKRILTDEQYKMIEENSAN